MARRIATKHSVTRESLGESLRVFCARRIVDGVGAALVLTGLAILAALISYDPADPSLNTATSGARIQNWMGTLGAWISDLFLQTLGAGGLVFGLVPALWGWRILTRRPVGSVALRAAAGILAALLLSAAFARLPAGGWIVHPYLGGSGGTLLLGRLSDALAALVPGWSGGLAVGLCAVMGSGALLFSAATSLHDVRAALARAVDLGLFAVHACLSGADYAREWVAAYGFGSARESEDFDGDEKPAPRRRARAAVQEDAEEEEEDVEEEEEEKPSSHRRSASSIKVVTPPARGKKPSSPQQGRFPLPESGEWILPAVDLLQEPPVQEWDTHLDENALRRNAEMLQTVLSDFNVRGEIETIHPGPVVTLYELEPAPGTKSSRVISLSDDIARSMSAVSVRCAVVPGRSVIGIELPNRKRQTVYMREILVSRDYEKTQARLPLVLGKDIGGAPVIADLSRMPHLLVAGTTGSGKSVAINTMILSLLYALPPEKCRFIMIDPKMLELSVYDGIPHLLSPVVTEPGKAVVALKWAVREMEDRYRAMSKLGVRNIDGYNARLKEARRKGEVLMRKVQTGFDPDTGKPVYEEQPLDLTELPYIVIIVDEFADLMLVAGKDVESAVQRLAQMARAAGLHLIMATQRPSVDVITGVIKANFPTRISFQVTSKIDSRTILGESGAEQLLGMGDMLYMAPGGRVMRVHGPFASDRDVENVVTHLKAQAEPAYIDDITDGSDLSEGSDVMAALFGEDGGGAAIDEFFDQAVALVAREGKASTSFIQRYFQIGYNRAARIIEEMERQGMVSPANAVGKREILLRRDRDE